MALLGGRYLFRASAPGFAGYGGPLDLDVKPVEQHLHVRVGLDVLVCEWLPVAAQELPDVLRAAECRDPSRTISLLSIDISAVRLRMKARMRISLSSGSRCTRVRRSLRSTAMTAPSLAIRPRSRLRRADSMLISPVNPPGWCTATGSSRSPIVRTTSIAPDTTTKKLVFWSPTSKSTSPARMVAPEGRDALDLRRREQREHLGGPIGHASGGHGTARASSERAKTKRPALARPASSSFTCLARRATERERDRCADTDPPR